MKRTNLYLDERQTAALDRLAGAQGISRAEAVRRLIDRTLTAGTDELDGDLAAIEASFGVLSGARPVHRGPDARAAHLDDLRHR